MKTTNPTQKTKDTAPGNPVQAQVKRQGTVSVRPLPSPQENVADKRLASNITGNPLKRPVGATTTETPSVSIQTSGRYVQVAEAQADVAPSSTSTSLPGAQADVAPRKSARLGVDETPEPMVRSFGAPVAEGEIDWLRREADDFLGYLTEHCRITRVMDTDTFMGDLVDQNGRLIPYSRPSPKLLKENLV